MPKNLEKNRSLLFSKASFLQKQAFLELSQSLKQPYKQKKPESLRCGCSISHKFPVVLKTITIIDFWLTLWQLSQISQVTNKLNTELKQKYQKFIIIAFFNLCIFCNQENENQISVSIHTLHDKLFQIISIQLG